ncbi:hypothetical protein FPSE_08739 [Fusarium pseudograminearum CS3096]|uniref:Uncharacterized protein n=1 Tax=Fusarium pseudograminearum (strain CS3096) TaxID=1028729 RepID=K3VYQ8_FUSPC|nr:hypothetical protein FPSE_08739 [Fusarium pseudograminearum CS3096]EKJ71075.1 hypothetical protein FPSE_08739 [Fusarium pseudograminearum CS3096]
MLILKRQHFGQNSGLNCRLSYCPRVDR